MKQNRIRKGKNKMLKILIALLVVIVVMVVPMILGNNKSPKLGVEGGKLSDMPKKPNAVSSQTDDTEKYVEPFPYKSSLESSRAAVMAMLNDYGNYEVVKEESNYLRVMFTTGKMKYHDDAEFYYDDEAQLIHYRSSSRIGYSDMGLNRERYNHMFSYYQSH